MIRYDIDIRLDPIDPDDARAAIAAHHREYSYQGDGFMPSHQLTATHRQVVVDGGPVGVAAYTDEILTLLTLAADAKRYDRQIVESVLHDSGRTQAYVASWDSHHVELFGSFAVEIDAQAYQFALRDPALLREPIAGLTLRMAVDSDLPYLKDGNYPAMLGERQLRIAELNRDVVGIGVAVPNPLNDGQVDIGMFVNDDRRQSGIGRSILTLLARETLDAGRRPMAGCWWRNWQSRRTLESAGLTCTGTILRLTLDPDRFRKADAMNS